MESIEKLLREIGQDINKDTKAVSKTNKISHVLNKYQKEIANFKNVSDTFWSFKLAKIKQ